MSFYERFESLCKERGLRPQSNEIIEIAGVSSPAITGWKKGSAPKADVLLRIATYFGVSVDYLLGNTDVKATNEEPNLNTVVVRGRDGSVIEKKLTDDQVKALQTIIDQLPDASDDL